MIQVKRITPGDPEFASIARTITPIHQVKAKAFPRSEVTADITTSKHHRRNEDTSKARG